MLTPQQKQIQKKIANLVLEKNELERRLIQIDSELVICVGFWCREDIKDPPKN